MRIFFAILLILVNFAFPGSIWASNHNTLEVNVVASNYSVGPRNWTGLVRAQPGETIEFKVDITNRSTEVARNVVVRVEFWPVTASPQPMVKVHARADNHPEVTGTASVVINMAQSLGSLVLRSDTVQPVLLGDLPPKPAMLEYKFLADVVVPPSPTQSQVLGISTQVTPTATPYPVKKADLPPKTPDTGFSAPVVGVVVACMGGIGFLLRRQSRRVW